jgi:hypothetical protein
MSFKYKPTDHDLLTLRIFMILLTIIVVIALGFSLTTCTQTDSLYSVDSDLEVLNESPTPPALTGGNGIVGRTNKPVPSLDSDDMMFLDTEQSLILDPLERITNDYFIDDVFVQEE